MLVQHDPDALVEDSLHALARLGRALHVLGCSHARRRHGGLFHRVTRQLQHYGMMNRVDETGGR